MLIGELSKRSGLSRDTIRFYEKKGLIKVDRRARRENNYKEYSESVLNRLLMIRRIKSFGFTLNETNEFMHLIGNNQATCHAFSHKIKDKLFSLDQKIAELYQLKQTILDKVNDTNSANCHPDKEENCQALVSD